MVLSAAAKDRGMATWLDQVSILVYLVNCLFGLALSFLSHYRSHHIICLLTPTNISGGRRLIIHIECTASLHSRLANVVFQPDISVLFGIHVLVMLHSTKKKIQKTLYTIFM
ncbi:hypothetical protein F5Y12DRAFT_300329 [Xylaria sp. FL1777]|nr:hypothetical protein F5Y12DRAFT_300329 [Xylaria sp. FL1777]